MYQVWFVIVRLHLKLRLNNSIFLVGVTSEGGKCLSAKVMFLKVTSLMVLISANRLSGPEKSQMSPVSTHSGLRGGIRNFFCRWGQGAYFSQLSRCPGPRSTSPTQNLSNLGPLGPKTDQKTAQIGQNGDLKVLVVPNGWNSVEQRWNGLGEVQVEDYEPILRSWVPPNLAQGPPKTAQICPTGPNLAI